MQQTELGFEVHLDLSYEQALEHVIQALKEQGFGVLTRIDVQATMKEKLNADFRPYSILGACNPPLAFKSLSANPEVGLMLPCNVTVEALGEAQSLVRIADPEMMLSVGGLSKDPALTEVAAQARSKLMLAAEKLESA
jgi:uncharacterized protein (DUF302 family)